MILPGLLGAAGLAYCLWGVVAIFTGDVALLSLLPVVLVAVGLVFSIGFIALAIGLTLSSRTDPGQAAIASILPFVLLTLSRPGILFSPLTALWIWLCVAINRHATREQARLIAPDSSNQSLEVAGGR